MSNIWTLCMGICIFFGLLKLIANYCAGSAITQARKHMQERRYKDALPYLNQVLWMSPILSLLSSNWKRFLSRLYYHRAYCYMHQEEYKLANVDFTKAIALDPTSVTAYMYRGEYFCMLGRLEEALQDLNIAVALESSNTMPELSESEFGEAGKIIPLLHRAAIHELMGHPDLAAKDRELAKQLVPKLVIIDKRNRAK